MPSTSRRESILFLYLPTGGGHVSAARALAEEIKKTSHAPDTDLHIVDPLEGNPPWVRSAVENGYTTSAVKIPFLWPLLYQSSAYAPVMAFQTRIACFLTRGYLARYIREHHITRIVVLHFLLTKPVQEALELLGRQDIPVLTVVLDPFTVHPLWAWRLKGPLVVFSPEARNRMVRRLRKYAHPGSDERKGHPDIRVVPPLIRSDFLDPLPPARVRQLKSDHGFSNERHLILLAGGGDGLLGGEAMLKALCTACTADGRQDLEIAMVCGKNKTQFHTCQAIARQFPDINIQIHGFTRIMYELMNMADLIIAKGGPATVFEVIALEKPLFISSYFYGQEKGNVDFVVRHGLGRYQSSPRAMAREVLSWLPGRNLFGDQHGLPHDYPSVLSQMEKPQAAKTRAIKTAVLPRSGAQDVVDILFNLPGCDEKRGN